MAKTTLVLGGVRSGKSRYAESLCSGIEASGRIYLATAEARDDEMTARIARHLVQRGSGWKTVEEPLDLVSAIMREDGAGTIILVECLTLWVSNLMEAGLDIATETGRLCQLFGQIRGQLVLVSNETGLGIMPMNKMAREFGDHAGRLNQAVAAAADRVVFIAAGLPLALKG